MRKGWAFRPFWIRLSKRVFLLFLTLVLAGCGPLSYPPHLAVAFAKNIGHNREDLWVGQFSAQGHLRGPLWNLGALGLVAQEEIMTAHGGTLWVTTGYAIWAMTPGRQPHVAVRAPKGMTLLAVSYLGGHLWVVAERLNALHVRIYEWNHGLRLRTRTPLAITTLVSAPGGTVAVLSADPNHATITRIGAHVLQHWTVDSPPQGTLAFGQARGYLPVTSGLRGFDMVTIPANRGRIFKRYPYPSVWRAVIAVMPTNPPYGLTVKGIVPLRAGQAQWKNQKPWPHPLQATMTTDGTGPGWALIVDGPSQGFWFNAQKDQFGPAFVVQAPAGAFARAVTPWP